MATFNRIDPQSGDALATLVRNISRKTVTEMKVFNDAYVTNGGRGQKRVNRIDTNQSLGPYRAEMAVIGCSTGKGTAGP